MSITHKNTWWWGKTHTIILEQGIGLVNVSVHNEAQDIATIHGISVHDSYRDMGYGDCLLERAENEARLMGAKSVELTARRGSWEELWYKRKGYEMTGECEDWDGDILTKDLM